MHPVQVRIHHWFVPPRIVTGKLQHNQQGQEIPYRVLRAYNGSVCDMLFSCETFHKILGNMPHFCFEAVAAQWLRS